MKFDEVFALLTNAELDEMLEQLAGQAVAA